ncbi:MAG: GNAT family N-acetyltransferase, partial [Dolichospermum sp.]
MTSLLPRHPSVIIRPVQHRDLDGIESLSQESLSQLSPQAANECISEMQGLRRWYGLLKFLSWFPNPLQYRFWGYIAEQGRMLLGMIQVSPFNRTRSTWRVNQVMLARIGDRMGVGSQLLRHCFESILEARTWILEVNVN